MGHDSSGTGAGNLADHTTTYTRRVRLTILGSNGTYPTPGRPASGYLVSGAASIWMDAGPGTLMAMQERSAIADVDAIVLSHGHGDHCLDMLPLFNVLRYGPLDRDPLPVFAPEGVADRLGAFIGAGSGHDFWRVFRFASVEPGDSAEVMGVRLSFGAAVHPVPALVTRIDDGDTSLTYSGDTGPGGDLVVLGSGTDLMLCESTHLGARPSDGYPFHLHAPEAGAAARDAGAARLMVTHVAPTLDPEVAVAEAAAVFEGQVDWAAPGLEVEL